jgi:hypothetical protein
MPTFGHFARRPWCAAERGSGGVRGAGDLWRVAGVPHIRQSAWQQTPRTGGNNGPTRCVGVSDGFPCCVLLGPGVSSSPAPQGGGSARYRGVCPQASDIGAVPRSRSLVNANLPASTTKTAHKKPTATISNGCPDRRQTLSDHLTSPGSGMPHWLEGTCGQAPLCTDRCLLGIVQWRNLHQG